MKAPTPEGVRERAAYVAWRLNGWANQMVVRFGEGTHVYLVGSYLTSESPRDLDISIVVPDSLFWRRYRDAADLERLSEQVKLQAEGSPGGEKQVVEDWNVHSEWTPDMLRWGREYARLTMGLFHAWAHLGAAGGGWPIDLKLMPVSEMEARHKGRLRLQIDTIPPPTKHGEV